MKVQSKYKVKAIRPYILDKHYTYSGYKTNNTDAENNKVATYAKPFAMFQMSLTDETQKINNFGDKTMIRCNVIAKNIEYSCVSERLSCFFSDFKLFKLFFNRFFYPYLANEELMGNALLGQPGHGWVQLGFSQKVDEPK